MKRKEIIETLLFVLPYVAVELTTMILIIIDKSISNSIGKTAIIVFGSFVTLNWAIDTIQSCFAEAHQIVLVRDKNNRNNINTTAVISELVISIFIGILLFVFANQVTYVYVLDDVARDILTIILKLKAIELPLHAIGLIAKNDLKAKRQTKTIWIITVIAACLNIIGDILSVKLGYNEIGIYVATIASTVLETALLFVFAKIKIGKFISSHLKDMLSHTKDFVFNKIVQRVVNILYTRIASTFGSDIYAIHCVCIAVTDPFFELAKGLLSGFIINYSRDIEAKKNDIVKKADSMEVPLIILGVLSAALFVYPFWWLLGNAVPWNECTPYIWFYSLEFIVAFAHNNYTAFLSAHKDTKPITLLAFVGGICVRIPLAYLIKYLGLGLIGLSLVCAIDRIVRTIYLRLVIKKKYKQQICEIM